MMPIFGVIGKISRIKPEVTGTEMIGDHLSLTELEYSTSCQEHIKEIFGPSFFMFHKMDYFV